jgi:hypothetical protein
MGGYRTVTPGVETMARKSIKLQQWQERMRQARERHPEIFEPEPEAQEKPLQLRKDGGQHGTVKIVSGAEKGKRRWWRWF